MHTASPQRAATSKLVTASSRRSTRAAPCRRLATSVASSIDSFAAAGTPAVVRDLGGVDGGEHASDDRHTECAADLPGELVHGGAVAGLLDPEVVHDHRRRRRDGRDRGRRRRSPCRAPGARASCPRRASSRGTKPPAAVSRPASRTTRGPNRATSRPPTAAIAPSPRPNGATSKPDGERRAVLDVLHVLGKQEQHPERCDVGGEDGERARCHARSYKHAHVEQRVGAAELDGEERERRQRPHRRGAEHGRARPSGVDTLDEREHDPGQSHGGERRAGEVERRRAGPARLGQPAQPERSGQQHEGDVDEKHPAPARHVDEHAADDRVPGRARPPRPPTRSPPPSAAAQAGTALQAATAPEAARRPPPPP